MRSDLLPTVIPDPIAAVAPTPVAQILRQRVEEGGVFSCGGVPVGSQSFVAALLHRLCPERVLVVVEAGVKTQEGQHQDLQTWSALDAKDQTVLLPHKPGDPAPGTPRPTTAGSAEGTSQPLFYPPWETLPHEERLPHADVISDRIETLLELAQPVASGARAPVVVTSVTALLQRTFRADFVRQHLRRLRRGDEVDPLDLIEWLEDQGYEPEAKVTQKGELALRGGIVDVFPLTSPWPVRFEFFGNQLESLRYFDPQTQVSRQEITASTLGPGGELGLLKRHLRGLQGSPDSSSAGASILGTFLDHLPSGTILLLCEPEALAEVADNYAAQVPPQDPFFFSWESFQAEAAARGLVMANLEEETARPLIDATTDPTAGELVEPTVPEPTGTTLDLAIQGLDTVRPLGERTPDPQIAEVQRRTFFAELHRWQRRGYALHVFFNNEGERERFAEIWAEYGFAAAEAGPGAAPAPAGVSTHLGTLGRGFLVEAAKVVVVTDAEVFGRYKVLRPRRLRSAHAQATRSILDVDFTSLEEGDYVVHLQHGIGRFLELGCMPMPVSSKPGFETPVVPSVGPECLVIEYAPQEAGQPPPKLYVPVSEAHLVSKYVGAGKGRPPLNTLGGTRWAKAKAKAAEAVRDVAADLLRVQAARASKAGHAYPPDAPWQREFEDAFIYEETPDQWRAIAETKRDMETARPMDRLVCGDVGFGKTEVAIRAAFKAVLAGKQVAVLVPTTVLAQQHYNTFRERMADYPVAVELLSRFRTRGDQSQVLRRTAAGAVDILIGTHRLVQSDVVFKELGLVVIDEEQRFGVLQKERLKELRQLVDVLTLTATPIPRTLYLALSGARDMSTIDTPPQDRLPIQTIIGPYDERTVRDAIQRELNRGGQVFYLHNRVFDIEGVAERLRALVPTARLEVGHGQMHSDQLEEVMTRFVDGQTDVLLSTTIIESGIDIPNANTIIIDRADRFGLSDLYQLRGRVGRYKHQAYAYLLLPRHAGLLVDARKRISAIKQFSSPGSGFKIAMRDLEIRGAGNLLGPQQSGHITAVGFDLYCQLLKQSVQALKGEPIQPRSEVVVRLDFLDSTPGGEGNLVRRRDGVTPSPSRPQPGAAGVRSRAQAAIPVSYVPDPQQRVELYRKVAQCPDTTTLESLRLELRDRFGPLPPPVELWLKVAGLKLTAQATGVTAIETRDDKLMLTREGDFIQVGGRFPRLTRKSAAGRLEEIRRVLGALEVNRCG